MENTARLTINCNTDCSKCLPRKSSCCSSSDKGDIPKDVVESCKIHGDKCPRVFSRCVSEIKELPKETIKTAQKVNKKRCVIS